MSKEYDHPYPPEVDELATCIAMLQGAKIRAENYVSNPFSGQSLLELREQQQMEVASEAIDTAVTALELLREALKK